MSISSNLKDSTRPLALSVDEVRLLTGLGRNKVLGLIHSGRLGHVRVGRRIIVPHKELEAFLTREARGGEAD